MNFRFKVDINKKDYDEFVSNFESSSFMQQSVWSNIKPLWSNTLVGLYRDEKIVATALILKKKLPLGRYLFYCPRGFVLDYKDSKILNRFSEEIYKYAKKQKAIVVKIDPYICFSEKRISEYKGKKDHNYYPKTFSEKSDLINKNLINAGFSHGGMKKEMSSYIQPRYTMAIPLINVDKESLNAQEIKQTFPKNVRNYIGDYHEKRGVQFRSSTDINELYKFINLLEITEKRQNISLRTKDYFKKIMQSYGKNAVLFFGEINLKKYLKYITDEKKVKNAKLDFLLSQEEQVEALIKEHGALITVSSTIVIMPTCKNGIKTATFLYAGTNTKVLPNLKVTNGLMFYRVLYALENNCHYCDLGGVSGHLDDHLSGFKSKFNPLVLEFIGEYNLIINKPLFFIFDKALPIFKKILLKIKK